MANLEPLRRATRRSPEDPETHYNLGSALLDQGAAEEALGCFRTALNLAPGHPQILLQMGNAWSALGDFTEAGAVFRTLLRIEPDHAGAHYNLGNALRELGQPEMAEASYRRALALNPQDADAHNNLGNVLRETGKLEQAIACYREALRINPDLHHARMHLAHQRQHACDWEGLDEEIAEIRRIVREVPRPQVPPFAFLALPGTTAEEQRRCAEQWVAARYSGHESREPQTRGRGKITIGYLSADFRQHPLASLATALMEQHDRDRFSIRAYAHGPDDKTPERRRWERAFDHFSDVRDLPARAIADRIQSDGVDILVDLTGFTQGSRSSVLAMRPAPIQVNWLGFPGTMGAPFVDYLISDAFITPPQHTRHYSEALVLLPDTYQPNGPRQITPPPPRRAACGLPEVGTVLCCFNQTFKITPQLFDLWCDLLKFDRNSVLWLLECNPLAQTHLRQEAARRGVAPERLIFAPRVPMDEHLARHRCADLHLDTLPYNAHTTASDALWMGLPLLTCAGDTFSGRVAGSLLRAVGMPHMVTDSLEGYAALARDLLAHPEQLHAMRATLDARRETLPLFDTTRFARNLEQAYLRMWQRHTRGLAAQSFTV